MADKKKATKKSTEKTRIAYADFKKKHPEMVVIHAQPDYVEIVDEPEELKQWARDVADAVGEYFPPVRGFVNPDDYPVGGSSPHTHTQTFYTEDGRNKRDHDCADE